MWKGPSRLWVAPSSSNPAKRAWRKGDYFRLLLVGLPSLSLAIELVYTVVFAAVDAADDDAAAADGDDSYTEVKLSICELSS